MMNHPKQIDRRRLRHTLGSRASRRQGTKSRIGKNRPRPASLMRQMVRQITSGSATMDDLA